MEYKLKAYSIWEFGQRKDAQGNPHQEDNIYPAFGKQKDSDRLFILCDGMGGHDAGEVASATVCDTMSKSVIEQEKAGKAFSDSVLQTAINAAFDELDKKDTGAVKKMGTTMTFLKLHEGGCTIAHMGDSRVYHIRPGKDAESTKILFVTRDHSLVNDMIKIGELTPEEAKNSPQKNIITRAMQPNMERRPRADIHHTVDIKPGDFFFLCSDGMLEEMDDTNVKYFFSNAIADDKKRVEMLKKQTKDNRDNHSAIIVHILGVEGTAPALAESDSNDDNADEGSEMVAIDNDGMKTKSIPVGRPIDLNQPVPKKKNNSLLAIVVGVIIVLVVAAFAYNQLKPEKPMTKPIREANDGGQRTVGSGNRVGNDNNSNKNNGGNSVNNPSTPPIANPSQSAGQANQAQAGQGNAGNGNNAAASQHQNGQKPPKPENAQQQANDNQTQGSHSSGRNGKINAAVNNAANAASSGGNEEGVVESNENKVHQATGKPTK